MYIHVSVCIVYTSNCAHLWTCIFYDGTLLVSGASFSHLSVAAVYFLNKQ